MNKDEIQGKSKQLLAKVKQSWGRLTDDDVALLNGKREEFYGKLQEKYGIARDEAEKRLRELEAATDRAA